MKELIDINSHVKFMAMICGGFRYQDFEYLFYGIRRENDEVNLFVSKLSHTSDGYVIRSDFENGEKEILDKYIQRMISREPVVYFENDGVSFIKNIELVGVNYFDVSLCYVSTVPRVVLKELLIFYDLVNEDMLGGPVVEVYDDKRKFNEGFAYNILLIIFGIFALCFCVWMVLSFIK